MMTREDYETQKRRLAEQHRSLVEMVDAAYQTQLRALDLVWRMMSGEGTPELLAPPATPAAAPAPPSRRRLRAGELKHDIAEVFYRLPDPFVFSDVYQAIGYEPDRGSLHRALQSLIDEGHVALHKRGTGTQPTRYRKLRVAAEGAGS
ncbi:MAG TPA: hypothetical protein VLR69_15890 [Thermoanaerobaculia bacterium]|nr:hypothetical protein [Thermoanaerobaculia bacterium]